MAKKKPSTSGGDASVMRRASRAVLRDIEAGLYVDCPSCGQRIKFQAKSRAKQVICNVYVDGVWDRVEHYHQECYIAAGCPHGPTDVTPTKRQALHAAAVQRGQALRDEHASELLTPA